MAIRPVLRMGDARLLQRAEPVSGFGSEELCALLADMRDTMQALNGAGLAAPQIGVNLRVVIFGCQSNPRYRCGRSAGNRAYQSVHHGAGRLSRTTGKLPELPGLRGQVPRFQNIRYQGYDEQGTLIDRAASGFHARVVQHECDHLDGILYPMRIRDITKFGYTEELFPGQALQDE